VTIVFEGDENFVRRIIMSKPKISNLVLGTRILKCKCKKNMNPEVIIKKCNFCLLPKADELEKAYKNEAHIIMSLISFLIVVNTFSLGQFTYF